MQNENRTFKIGRARVRKVRASRDGARTYWRAAVYMGGREHTIWVGWVDVGSELEQIESALCAVDVPPDPKDGSVRVPEKQSSIYFVQAGETGPIKIGWSVRANVRLSDLQTGCPEPLRLLGAVPGKKHEERMFHRMFRHARIRGEWFHPVPSIVALATEYAAIYSS